MLCLSTLAVSCNHNLSNRQERVLYGGCEGCYEPIYVRVHNVTTTDTVWMSFDINNFLNCFCPQNMSCESFKKKLEETQGRHLSETSKKTMKAENCQYMPW